MEILKLQTRKTKIKKSTDGLNRISELEDRSILNIQSKSKEENNRESIEKNRGDDRHNNNYICINGVLTE